MPGNALLVDVVLVVQERHLVLVLLRQMQDVHIMEDRFALAFDAALHVHALRKLFALAFAGEVANGVHQLVAHAVGEELAALHDVDEHGDLVQRQ